MNRAYNQRGLNYFDVNTRVKGMANNMTRELGYRIVLITRLSNAPADNYLYRVMAIKETGMNEGSYAVWTLNVSKGMESLNNGCYDLDFITAYKVFGQQLMCF